MKVYLVGGAVRDELLGRNLVDHDYVVVGETMESMLRLGYQQVGVEFPVFLDPIHKEEYALARTEKKTGQGHKGFKVDFDPSVTLEQDLQRRDLTINAIAKTAEGQLIDPYHGQRDLQMRVLRHVSAAFVEDPLRVLRVARFAAQLTPWSFKIAPATLTLMRQLVDSGELTALTPERVFQETEKALLCDDPDVYFSTLQACGALKVLMPSLLELDNLALQWAKRLSSEPEVVWAVLYFQGDESIDELSKRIKLPNKYNRLAIKVKQFFPSITQLNLLSAQQVYNLLQGLDAYRRPEILTPMIAACQALHQQRDYPQGQLLYRCWQLSAEVTAKSCVNKNLIGKQIGEYIQQQRITVIASQLI